MEFPFTRTRPSLVILTAAIISGLAILTYVDGPIDHIPRIRVSATSPDGALSVNVYKKRLSISRVGILVRISNQRKQLIYDRIIHVDGWWHWDFEGMYSKISFEGEEIRIGPRYSPDEYFVITRQELDNNASATAVIANHSFAPPGAQPSHCQL